MHLAFLPKRGTMARREAYWFYGLITPWTLGFLLFTAYPIISSILLSLMRWDLVHSPKPVGFSNYTQALTRDPLFWQSLKVTAIYTFGSVPIRLAAGLAVAILMNQKIPWMPFFRTIWYLPSVVSGVAVAILWLWIFNPYFGLLNYLIWLIFRVQGPFWLAKEELVLPAFIIMSLWSVGGGMVIVLAALQGVPTELYEAAEIDGAARWSKFLHITIPMVSPVIFFNLVTGIIDTFQVFTAGYVMTSGGPNNASLFYVLYLYRNAWQYLAMGYASALAWILFVVIMFFTVLVLRSSSLWVHYEGVRAR